MNIEWRDLADEEKILLLAVDSIDPNVWSVPADGPEAVYSIIERARSRFRIDPNRIYLFGHSAGGEFSLLVGLMQSRYFAAVAASAARLPRSMHPMLDFVDRRIPVAILAGEKDPVFPLTEIQETREALEMRAFRFSSRSLLTMITIITASRTRLIGGPGRS